MLIAAAICALLAGVQELRASAPAQRFVQNYRAVSHSKVSLTFVERVLYSLIFADEEMSCPKPVIAAIRPS